MGTVRTRLSCTTRNLKFPVENDNFPRCTVRKGEKLQVAAREYEEVRNVLLLHVSLLGNGTSNQTDRPTYARAFTRVHAQPRPKKRLRTLPCTSSAIHREGRRNFHRSK